MCQVVIVTGGASGFGAGICARAARDGHKVVVADLDAGVARTAAGAYPDALGLACDVAEDAAWQDLVTATLDRYGRIDVVVNNAGFTHMRSAMEDVTPADYERVFAVNMRSLYLCSRHAVPVLKGQRRGMIVNVASSAAFRPGMALTWYAASKGAVVTATQGMAMELAAYGVRANALAPVIGETGLMETFMGAKDSPATRERFSASIPLGRFCRPEDVAGAVAFLMGPDGGFVNGHCLPVDGGWLAGAFARRQTQGGD